MKRPSGAGSRARNKHFAVKIMEVPDNREMFEHSFDRTEFPSDNLIQKLKAHYQDAIKKGRTRQSRPLGTIFFPFFNPP